MSKFYFALSIKTLISTAILYVILQNIPFSEIWQTMITAQMLLVIPALLIIPIQVWVAANQIKILTNHHQMGFSVKQLFDINFSIQFYTLFLPGRLAGLLGESWILVNTSMREGLPTSFLEAMGHRCALLSRVNPDDVVSRFGYHAEDDDFATGLANLLEGDAWRDKGEAGYRYVRDRFDLVNVIKKHLQAYRALMQG